jgi:hypothetical protein
LIFLKPYPGSDAGKTLLDYIERNPCNKNKNLPGIPPRVIVLFLTYG